MSGVAIAAGSPLAADAGRVIAEAGGNAVDAAIAAVVASMCTDPGIIAPGAGAFIAVWPSDGPPVVIDAYAEMPGRGLSPEQFGEGARRVAMEYGGGIETLIGHGSVATPGAFAGLGAAHDRFGSMPWADLLEPTIVAVAGGFPLSGAAAEYLSYSHEIIFGWDPESHAALHHPDGSPITLGETVRLPALADTLRALAAEGPALLYEGELGGLLVAAARDNGGLITKADLAQYRAVEREPTLVRIGEWTVATNPPPAVGGACMAAMLLLMEEAHLASWSGAEVRKVADAQRSVLTYRRGSLDGAADRAAAVTELLDLARIGDVSSILSAPSTSHSSTVDAEGAACAITVSAGYGSGAMIPGTGFWLNNSLGEIEL
ncbi:MAG: gamma-glutamyltransferase, partial [Acidimicrobiia bacterium]